MNIQEGHIVHSEHILYLTVQQMNFANSSWFLSSLKQVPISRLSVPQGETPPKSPASRPSSR